MGKPIQRFYAYYDGEKVSNVTEFQRDSELEKAQEDCEEFTNGNIDCFECVVMPLERYKKLINIRLVPLRVWGFCKLSHPQGFKIF
jgi:hypothetical protein